MTSQGFYSLPKRTWDSKLGVSSNILKDLTDLSSYLLPKSEELSNNVQLEVLTGKSSKYLDCTDQIDEAITKVKDYNQ